MKNLLFIILLNCVTLSAQEKLTINYEFRNEIDTTGVTNPEMLEDFQAQNSVHLTFQLTTSKNESNFKRINREKDIKPPKYIDNGLLNFNLTLYKNLTESYTLTTEVYKNKTYLVKDLIDKKLWNFIDETSTLLGYEIKKATYMQNGILIEAWYAPALPYQNGPDEYSGLPGQILKVSYTILNAVPLESFHYTAIKIDNKSKLVFSKPTKGQIISREDYETMLMKIQPSIPTKELGNSIK